MGHSGFCRAFALWLPIHFLWRKDLESPDKRGDGLNAGGCKSSINPNPFFIRMGFNLNPKPPLSTDNAVADKKSWRTPKGHRLESHTRTLT